jgi:D-inositol-3-phosphate glycosyltransferase
MAIHPDTDGSSGGEPGGQPRAAIISLHTSPTDQPGSGDSGGMNVYILRVAQLLARQGIDVDVFTRNRGDGPEIEQIGEGARLIRVQAGPGEPVPKEDLPPLLPQFLDNVLHRATQDRAERRHHPYDVVHSHYWLSGWVGERTKEIWGAPLVASFHTLGKVKNFSLANGDRPEPRIRLDGERSTIRGADRILAPTPVEAAHLVGLYGADPERIRIVPPGVDRVMFVPKDKAEARSRLHVTNARLLLFVGRLQPLKGPDIAIRALAEAVARAPELTRDAVLAVVGGPTGAIPHDEVVHLMQLAASAGVGDRVVFFPPQPHGRLADFYAAAEVVLVPSRSESFGLVALEAQACGTPVIAAAVGGLRYSVADGVSGYLVEGHDPGDYADRIILLLSDPAEAVRLSAAAAAHASAFSWESTAAGIRDVYLELAGSTGVPGTEPLAS